MGWGGRCHLGRKWWREGSAEGRPQAFSRALMLGRWSRRGQEIRSGNAHPHTGNLAQIQLAKRTSTLPHTADMPSTSCCPLGQRAADCAPLPPSPVPSIPTALAFLWPHHFSKRTRCQGKLAALRGRGVQADVIPEAASVTSIREGG